MKRDMDLIRDLLMYVEEHHNGAETLRIDYNHFSGFDSNAVYGHLSLLTEAGVLIGHHQSYNENPKTKGLSWDGHDFLGSVRDPEIWRKTKAAGEKVGGWTVGLLVEYAKGLIKIQFDNILGASS